MEKYYTGARQVRTFELQQPPSRPHIQPLVLVHSDTEYELPTTEWARHTSPDGFEWGFFGAGPAALAHSVLVDVLGDTDQANRHAHAFKIDVIAQLPRGDLHLPATLIWVLSANDIRRWWWVQNQLTQVLDDVKPCHDHAAAEAAAMAPFVSPLVIYPWSTYAAQLAQRGYAVEDAPWTRQSPRPLAPRDYRILAETARCGRCGQPCHYAPARRAQTLRAFMVCRVCNAADEF